MTSDPRTFYRARLEELALDRAALDARENRITSGRMLLFAAAAILAWLSISLELFSPAFIFVPVAAFVALIVVHERVKVARARVGRIESHFLRGIERLEGTWSGKGLRGDEFLDPHHPFAGDLDLFGRGSLYELLCTARTKIGQARLAHWLLNPASSAEIATRRTAIGDLAPRVELRERLATIGTDESRALDAPALQAWASTRGGTFSTIERLLATFLGAAGIISAVVLLTGNGSLPFLLVVLGDFALGFRLQKRVREALGQIVDSGRELTLVAQLLRLITSEKFEAPHLRTMFSDGSRSGAGEIERLVRLIDLHDAMRNQFFAPFGALLLWQTQIAFRIAAWRERNGAQLVQWIENVGTFEALTSLATLAFERPEYVHAEIVEGKASYVARDLAHPLLGPEAVANDVTLGEPERLWIVSGSNMSGKSTLMRSIGVNAVLAYCGAPVRAASLRLSRFHLGASIRINDSLQEGASRFYAEVSRVQQIVALSRSELPLLFLLDEMFGGTNSHDRQIGAAAILRKLVESGAIGLVTTHDLALSRLADELPPGLARNVHFEDHLENGRMTFDYRLKEGVVTRSNALELMRAVGLEV